MSHSEQTLIHTLLHGEHDALAAQNLGITPLHFHEYRIEYEWLIDYRVRYRAKPLPNQFHSQFQDFGYRAEVVPLEAACDQVRKTHLRFGLMRSMREGQEFIRQDREEESLKAQLSSLTRLANSYDTVRKATKSLVDPSEIFEQVSLRLTRPETSVIKKFFHNTPSMRSFGVSPGELCVWAARPSQGKSWTLVNEAVDDLLDGKTVLYYSLEMSRRAMEHRFNAVLAHRLGYRLSHREMSRGKRLDLIGYKKFLTEMPNRVPGSLYINDSSRGKITAGTAAGQISEWAPDNVYFDYVSLMSTTRGERATDGWQAVAAIIGELKSLAQSFGVRVYTANQINRDGENVGWKPARLSNLAGSDSVGQDADFVVTMKGYGQQARVYSMEKARDAESGYCWFSAWDPDFGDFHEITRAEADALKAQEALEEMSDQDYYLPVSDEQLAKVTSLSIVRNDV